MSKFKKHIVIVGTARSGTSWLSETMAAQHRYRMLFEPEHETQTTKGYLLCDKWISSQNVTKEIDRYLIQIFCNRVDSNWIAQNSNRKFKRHLWPFIPKKFIIKFVRANLLAEYINERFKIPVIHLLRNPYDVISSQQKVKFPWLYDLSHFANQKSIVNLLSDKFNIDVEHFSTLSDVEKLTMRWCIENVIPLEVSETYLKHVSLLRYEDLFSDISQYYKLCKAFDIEPISNLEQRYKTPSSKTYAERNVLNANDSALVLTISEREKINVILNTFKTSLYPIE